MAFYETSNSDSGPQQPNPNQSQPQVTTLEQASSQQNWIEVGREELTRHLTMQGRIKQLVTLMGLNWMNEGQRRQSANEQAETEWYRRQLGLEPQQTSTEEFDMKNVQLGDINNPAPIIIAPPAPQPPNNSLQNLLMGGLATGMAGVIGYLVAGGNQQPSQVPQPNPPAVTQPVTEPVVQPLPDLSYESLEVGLGQIEDYIKPGG